MLIQNSGSGIFTRVLFKGNTANDYGGAVFVGLSGSVTFISCSWNGNTAPANRVRRLENDILLFTYLRYNY